jgi:hypothetical protein
MSVTTIGSGRPGYRPYRLRTNNDQVQTEARTGGCEYRPTDYLERFSYEAEEARGGIEKRANLSGRPILTFGRSDATWRPSSFPVQPIASMRSDATRILSLIGLRALERSQCRVTRGGIERTDVNRSARRTGSCASIAALSCSPEPSPSN